MRRVILVTGPPCVGKSHYVNTHAGPGDTILDQDQMGGRAMALALRRLPDSDGTTWVIRCLPGQRARDHLAYAIGATERVHLTEPMDVLIARATQRPDPRRQVAAIGTWHADETRDRAPKEPTVKGDTTARGYGSEHKKARARALADLQRHDGRPCPRCDEPMWFALAASLDLDHTDDRTGYQGLAHASCNRRAGQAASMRARSLRNQERSRNW